MVERLFLAVPWGCLGLLIVVFPDHSHLLFLVALTRQRDDSLSDPLREGIQIGALRTQGNWSLAKNQGKLNKVTESSEIWASEQEKALISLRLRPAAKYTKNTVLRVNYLCPQYSKSSRELSIKLTEPRLNPILEPGVSSFDVLIQSLWLRQTKWIHLKNPLWKYLSVVEKAIRYPFTDAGQSFLLWRKIRNSQIMFTEGLKGSTFLLKTNPPKISNCNHTNFCRKLY